ncbi:MAG: hypothetical protein WAL59_11605 [Roseiarcus sp.]
MRFLHNTEIAEDVLVDHNYGGRDPRGWFPWIIPLWTPELARNP